MNKLYMGIDVGTVYVKGIVIDEYNNIIISSMVKTLGSPILAVKKVILKIKDNLNLGQYMVVSVGVTGSARKLIGILLNSQVVKNEVTALATGVIKIYPDIRTIIDIGGESSKIITINDGVITNYAINSSCNAGAGSFIDSLAQKIGIDIEAVSGLAIMGNKINVLNNCMIFAESDLIHKMQEGYKKSDILAGACNAVCQNYLNGVAKGKKVMTPIFFSGGVSKNTYIVNYLKKILGENILVSKNSQFMCAMGIAILARNSGKECEFNFDIEKDNVETKLVNCMNCASNCEIVTVYKNDSLIDMWGNKCDKTEKNM